MVVLRGYDAGYTKRGDGRVEESALNTEGEVGVDSFRLGCACTVVDDDGLSDCVAAD